MWRWTPVTVRAVANGDHVALEVADRGPGLSREEAQRAFEPFYRSDPSRDRTTGGAGLGLAIVAAIAKAHGGTVDVTGTPGGGATFRVLLPRDDGRQPSVDDANGAAAAEPERRPDASAEPATRDQTERDEDARALGE